MLSDNFSFDEMTRSQTATRKGWNNEPDPILLPNLARLASVLEDVRSVARSPVIISSGYRSPKLNRSIGGSSRSAHMDCRAADFTARRFGSPFKLAQAIADTFIGYDQLIYEGNWVHLAIPKAGEKPRKLVYTAIFKKWSRTKYVRGIIQH